MTYTDRGAVLIERDEAVAKCHMGEGDKCCAFLVAGIRGLECVRMSLALSPVIVERLRNKTMVAKGRGGWEGCVWHGQIPDDDHPTTDPLVLLQKKYDRIHAAAVAVVGSGNRGDLTAMIGNMKPLQILTGDNDLAKAIDLMQALLDTME